MSETDLETAEAKMTLEKLLEENDALREKLAIADALVAQSAQSLGIANSEAEVFRRQAAELKLRLEALGLDGAGGNTAKLEQRLLKAVSDLRIADEDRKKLSEALSGLTDTLNHYLKTATSPDPEARLALEAQLRRCRDSLAAVQQGGANGEANAASMNEGMVISVKEELSLVVANIGTLHGVKLGAPFQVLRADRVIGTVRMVDVRERIAGALVQNLNSDKERIKVGDRLRVDAQH